MEKQARGRVAACALIATPSKLKPSLASALRAEDGVGLKQTRSNSMQTHMGSSAEPILSEWRVLFFGGGQKWRVISAQAHALTAEGGRGFKSEQANAN